MTTSQSSIGALRKQAQRIALWLKQAEAGTLDYDPQKDPGGKIAAARKTDSIRATVVMDDKILSIEITWETIRATTEHGLAEYVLKHMRGNHDTAH